MSRRPRFDTTRRSSLPSIPSRNTKSPPVKSSPSPSLRYSTAEKCWQAGRRRNFKISKKFQWGNTKRPPYPILKILARAIIVVGQKCARIIAKECGELEMQLFLEVFFNGLLHQLPCPQQRLDIRQGPGRHELSKGHHVKIAHVSSHTQRVVNLYKLLNK